MQKAHLQKSLLAFALLAAFALPTAASAASAPAVQTRQILPVGSNSCAPITVSTINEYVADGDLNSFQLTVSDPSYVALLGTIGGAPLSFRYMTRDITPDGMLRIHVDVPIEMSHSSAISVLLLSAQGNATCMTTVAFGVAGVDGSSPQAPETDSGVTPNTPVTGGASEGGTSHTPTKPNTKPAEEGTSTGTTTVVGESPVARGSLSTALNAACDATGAYQLWFVLLALFVVIVAIVALRETDLSARSQYLPGALIMVPLILLLAFWLLAEDCRAAVWIPLILFVIAAIGLTVSYRKRQAVQNIIELPPANR